MTGPIQPKQNVAVKKTGAEGEAAPTKNGYASPGYATADDSIGAPPADFAAHQNGSPDFDGDGHIDANESRVFEAQLHDKEYEANLKYREGHTKMVEEQKSYRAYVEADAKMIGQVASSKQGRKALEKGVVPHIAAPGSLPSESEKELGPMPEMSPVNAFSADPEKRKTPAILANLPPWNQQGQ